MGEPCELSDPLAYGIGTAMAHLLLTGRTTQGSAFRWRGGAFSVVMCFQYQPSSAANRLSLRKACPIGGRSRVEGQVGEPLFDLAEQLQPVHAGHIDVGEDRDQRRLHRARRAAPCPVSAAITVPATAQADQAAVPADRDRDRSPAGGAGRARPLLSSVRSRVIPAMWCG